MNLTYFVMIEMLEATHDKRGQIVGRLSSHINMEDYLSSDNMDTNRLFFNENAAKGISDYLRNHGDDEKLVAKIVGIPEKFSIFDFEDEPIEDFNDVIDIFPGVDERYNSLTGEFVRQASSEETIEFDKSPIVFERLETIVEDLDVPAVPDKETSGEVAESDEALIRELMPTHETLQDIVNARLGITDDNEFSEVIISQSEASLAIMQTLMSEDLSEVEDVDVDLINRRIFAKIQNSEAAKDYILASRIYSDFIDETRSKETEIRGQYQRDLDAYIAEVIEKVEREYRATVPDLTEQNVQAYYESIAPLFTDRSNERERTQEQLQSQIINEFVSADRSPVLKSLRKFLVLKEQIRQSAISAILRVKAKEEQRAAQTQPVAPAVTENFNSYYPDFTENVEDTHIQDEPVEEIQEHFIPQTEPTPIEDVDHNETFDNEEIEEIEEIEDHFEETPEEYDEDFDLGSDEDFDDEIEDIEDKDAEETENIVKAYEDEEDMSLDQHVDVSQVDISAISLDDDELDADSEEPEFDEEDEEDIENAEELEEDKKSKKRGKDKDKKKMGIFAKIGLSILGIVVAGAVTFGTIYFVKGGKHQDDPKNKTSNVQSRTVGDTVFNVGDTVKIVGQDGQSLDVKIKEFKEDGSAVASDANGDLWLITAEQMKQYADKHPDLFKKKDNKDSNKDGSFPDKQDKKDNKDNKDAKNENKSAANNSSDKKDDKKSTDKKDDKKSGN